MSSISRCTIAASVLAFALSPAWGTVVSGNYCSVAPIVDFPAGVIAVGNWNDLTGPASYGPNGSILNPIYDNGTTATGTKFSWTTSDGGSQNTNDYVFRPFPPNTLGNHIQDGHDQLMAGYLQASKHSSSNPVITLLGENLNTSAFGGSYDVIVYFDGDDDVQSNTSRVQFRVWNTEQDAIDGYAPLASYYGRDAVGSNFSVDHTVAGSLSDYMQINSTNEFAPTLGNYVMFSGLTGSEFYIQMTGVAGQSGVSMAGFQVASAPVPEPLTITTMALTAGAMAGYVRRRRSSKQA